MLKDLICQHYLNLIYQNAQVKKRAQDHCISETYGEILYPSMESLLSVFNLCKQDVFVDLGSGLGKIAIYVFLRSQVQEVHGVEIIPELHDQALAAANRVYRELPEFFEGNRKLIFTMGDFLKIPLEAASVLFIGASCFSPAITYKLGEIINASTHIHTVLTLRPIPNLERLLFKKTVRVECSWDTALCYIYTL